ncbi:MAG: hypothetical protein WCI78_17935, partial [Mycobacterium sp.]
ALLAADREPYGGYEFAATRARARQAVTDAIVGTLGVAEQVFTGVRKIISSGLVAVTAFAQTLADTGEIITALQAGLAPVRASVETALNDTAAAVQGLREAVYIDLTDPPSPGGSWVAARPIPTLAAPAAATAARVAAKPRAAAVSAAADQPTPAAKISKSAGAHKTRAAARTRSLG